MREYTPEELLQFAIWAAEAIEAEDLQTAHEAFKPIFNHYYRRIFFFIRSRLRGSYNQDDEARELTSQTFLELWKKLSNFSHSGGLSCLIYTIAERVTHRRSRYNLRELSRRVTPQTNDHSGRREHLELLSGREHDQESEAMARAQEDWRRENAARLMEEVRTTTPEAHRFLELYYDQQLPCNQIAKLLGISHDAARFRSVSARLTLFEVGWRIIRDAKAAGSVRLRSYRPRSVKDLASIVARDPLVPELFAEFFGAASWHLVKPKRPPHAQALSYSTRNR